jgi:hypothetical protein
LGSGRRHEYHHHLGYLKEHWLSVEPLCARCHHIESRRERGLETFVPEVNDAVPKNAR